MLLLVVMIVLLLVVVRIVAQWVRELMVQRTGVCSLTCSHLVAHNLLYLQL